MIVMRSKQTGVAPLDIRCDTVACSFCSIHLGEATPSSFHSNQESILTRPPPRFLLQMNYNL